MTQIYADIKKIESRRDVRLVEIAILLNLACRRYATK